LLHVLKGHESSLVTAEFSPDGNEVLTGSFDSDARIWDTATGETQRLLPGHNGGVNFALFSPDGTRILTVDSQKTARIWDAKADAPPVTLEGRGTLLPTSAAFSADGKRVVMASGDTSDLVSARIWNAETGKSVQALSGHEAAVETAAFSPDGKWVLTGAADNTARVWDSATGQPVSVLKGHEAGVTIALFSPDGARILTGSERTVRIWDAATGNLLRQLKGHEGWLGLAMFSPDGSRVLAVSDKTVHLWDAETGEIVQILKGGEGNLRSAAFSGDGSSVITGSEDGIARLWEIDAALPIRVGYLRASIEAIRKDERFDIGLSPAPVGSTTNTWRQCNALAAHPFDSEVMSSRVPWDLLEHDIALLVCEKAVRERPENPQLLYQLARAQARAANSTSKGYERTALEKAARANYRAAEASAAKDDQHYPIALYALAELDDTPPEEAMTLLRQAHEGQIILAARAIARHYAEGKGVTRDMTEALRWLNLGANKGDPWAEADLGRMYWNGDDKYGVKQDWEQALFHFTRAVSLFEEHGYSESAEIEQPMLCRANLARHLSMQKVAEIWDRVQNWKPNPVSVGPRTDKQNLGAAAH
jgi:hypothetical protein